MAALLVALVLIFGGGGATATYFLLSAKDDGGYRADPDTTDPGTPPPEIAPTPTVPAEERRDDTTSGEQDGTPPAAQPTSEGTDAAEPAAVVEAIERHWAAIDEHRFETAYNDYANPNTSRAKWGSAQEREGIKEVEYAFKAENVQRDTAVARVVTLVTTDERCGRRSWSGSYQMVKGDGRWLIGEAEVQPSREC